MPEPTPTVPGASDSSAPAEAYRRRAAEARVLRAAETRRSIWIGRLRFVTFLVAFGLWVIADWVGAGAAGAFRIAAAVTVAGFLVLVRTHRRVKARERRLEMREELAEEGLARLARQWDALPDPPPFQVDPSHLYAHDLDLFGRASLVQILGPAPSPLGWETLRRWLLEPAPPAVVRERQEAIRELASNADLRDEMAIRLRLIGPVDPDTVTEFLAWAEEPAWLVHRPWSIWGARILPFLILGLTTAHVAGTVAHPLWLVPLVGAFLLLRSTAAPVRRALDRASSGDRGLRRLGEILEPLATESYRASLLRRLRGTLAADGIVAPKRIRALARLLHLADARLSSFHFLVNVVTLWDLHVLHGLERWKKGSGERVREWFMTLGEVEALAALATLAHDHPSWAYPTFDERGGEPLVRARELGHPLLAPARCITNDVELGPPGSFLLVTGSNMSGKSTLLRAVGVNVVLAQAGGPVCADEMVLPTLRLATSMRIQDSLQEGVSHFMAELGRLKAVVDAARSGGAPTGSPPLLYLLDEILQGTNSSERQIAARTVIRLLLGLRCVGAVTTHDLSLADSADLDARSQKVHFRETVLEAHDASLSFDYRLRPGLATTTNALKLLEIVGLGAADGDGSSRDTEIPETTPEPR